MPILARVIANAEAWVGIEATENDANFPPTPLHDVTDRRSNKVSFWEVDATDGAEMDRLIAAVFAASPSSTGALKKFEFRFARLEVVQELGIVVQNNKGNTIDKDFADRHRDLIVDTVGKAIQLAREMIIADARSVPATEVGELLIRSVTAKHLSLDEFKPDLYKELYKRGLLTIV